jgi:hypothetical protein
MIKYKDVKLISALPLLPFPGFRSITLFGYAFTRTTPNNKEGLKEYLATSRGKVLMNHENIHVLQKKCVKSWILFYILYIWYFLKLYLCTFNSDMCYRTIPFEAEAYINQNDMNYSLSHWKDYKKNNKERKLWYMDTLRYIR